MLAECTGLCRKGAYNLQGTVAPGGSTCYFGLHFGEGANLMANLAIQREVVIEAPVEVVWRTITDPNR